MSDETETARDGMPLIGDQFPEIEAETTHGTLSLPDDYEDEWFVLFSHPGDFTPVCTSEFVAFQQRSDEFADLDANLVGLSVDRVHSHLKWTEWIDEELDVDIEFPIIADERGRVAEKLGMLHPGAGTATVRSVFLVDPDGVLRLILYYPMEIGRNIDEILRSLKALQLSDDEDVAVPGDWPDNQKFGDKVLLSPPSDAEGVEARLEAAEDEDYDCKDWWFCLEDA
ncbi:peroxiredoxin [Halorussus ruber]|uniref:peroxiredoxin n=1 Tax=Halorussus ruber TaxID=1126238 RepID=UPI001091F148|nr:peroxiredoxin [Halorussus ruber]